MATITIPEADTLSFKDFNDGNSIQVRAVITQAEERDYEKGQRVTVSHNTDSVDGKIVSDPIVINENTAAGKKTLSLIVEKV